MVMVLTIAACHSAGKIDIWNLGRADFRQRYSSGICFTLSTDWNLWAYTYPFVLGLLLIITLVIISMVMMAMVMMVMVMMAMVMMADVDDGDGDDSKC
jgi:uncharacterized membrane protein